MYTLSVDIGGTFTDIVAFDEAKERTVVGKALTTPGDLRKGVMAGLEQAASELNMPLKNLLGEAHRFVHATTQSSNAIFAFAGAKTAVVTTRGFGDTLTIMRATGRVAGLSVFERYHYRATEKPRMLVDERDIFEVAERMDYAGRAVTKLDESEMREIAKTIKARGYEAVAVSFLFSHKNDAHEERAREIVKEIIPGVYVTISSEVAPVLGEYERSATTLFNAYVGPVIESYLEGLVSTLGEGGLKCKPLIAQANGGLATPAQTIPIFTVESGPAAGVVGQRIPRQSTWRTERHRDRRGWNDLQGRRHRRRQVDLFEGNHSQPVSAPLADDRCGVDRRRRRFDCLGGQRSSADRSDECFVGSGSGLLWLRRRPADRDGCRSRPRSSLGRQIPRRPDDAGSSRRLRRRSTSISRRRCSTAT